MLNKCLAKLVKKEMLLDQLIRERSIIGLNVILNQLALVEVYGFIILITHLKNVA